MSNELNALHRRKDQQTPQQIEDISIFYIKLLHTSVQEHKIRHWKIRGYEYTNEWTIWQVTTTFPVSDSNKMHHHPHRSWPGTACHLLHQQTLSLSSLLGTTSWGAGPSSANFCSWSISIINQTCKRKWKTYRSC